MRKTGIVPLILGTVLFIAGIIFIILGLPQNPSKANGAALLTSDDVQDTPQGKPVKFSINDEDIAYLEEGIYVYAVKDDLYVIMKLDGDSDRRLYSLLLNGDTANIAFKGKFDKLDDKTLEYSKTAFSKFMGIMYGGAEVPDSEIEYFLNCLSDRYIIVTEVYGGDVSLRKIAVGAGGVLLGIIFILCGLFPVKKVLLVFSGMILSVMAVFTVFTFDRIRSILSVEKKTEGLYTINCRGDLHTDDYLNGNFTSIDDVIDWLEKKLFFGVNVSDTDISRFGCTAFSASTKDGKALFGRNFDYDETDQVLVHTKPKNRYESIGMADLSFIGVGSNESIGADTFAGRYLMLAAPYLVMDGINEKGVGVGILQLDIGECHQDNGKPDILIFQCIRGILDNCASVGEAVEFLDRYDIHTMSGASYHLFITDASGNSVVCEWLDNEMIVIGDKAAANHVLAEGKYYLKGDPTTRYNILHKKLDSENGVLEKNEAMELLAAASQKDVWCETEWSCVYDIDNFSVDICIDNDFENVFSFSGKDI